MHPKRSTVSLACVVTLLFTMAVALQAQRLPSGVLPQHYSLLLAPNLRSASFSGDETIDVVLAEPEQTIVLNAAQIQFHKVSARSGGKDINASVTVDEKKQQATLEFDRALAAGPAAIHITYDGILNNELRGFYLSKTAKRNYAVTQFEATDARRAFPSFDEPAFKATYDIGLVIDAGDTAISNTNIISDKPGPAAGEHTVKFATTPRMSTYLVAFIVGDFQCVSGESDGVPIRACATPDKVQLGRFAVTSAEYILHYYNQYFGIKYPMPKLDMIALPDFQAGAMENFGAITYRETALLVDEKTASVAAKKTVALVVAHEMAHQWFGDMVTMQWWDNIWLNEGFATWMEHKPLTAWKPEWNVPEEVASDLDATMNLDAGRTTRTIRAKADTPGEINEMFDGISYGKAGAVLRMVEHYLGEPTFQQGVHNYLAAHLYANATAEDFWNALTTVSQKPVDKIMSSFVAQPGVPLLHFGTRTKQGVPVQQERFFLNANTTQSEKQTWAIPVCQKTSSLIAGVVPGCNLFDEAAQEIALPQAPLFYANADGTGYYRSIYSPSDYHALSLHVETDLNPVERISLLGDEWALVHSGHVAVGDYLDLVTVVKDDSSDALVARMATAIGSINSEIASSEVEQAQLAAWVRLTFAPALARLGPPSSNDLPGKRLLRATLFGLLGTTGKDHAVIEQAKAVTAQFLEQPAAVDATFAHAALRVAASNGDELLFNQLVKATETATDPDVALNTRAALIGFSDPALQTSALNYLVSGKVRTQDSLRLLSQMLAHRGSRDVTWDFVEKNWDRVSTQVTPLSGGRLVAAAGSFCRADAPAEVEHFFTTHKVGASERALKQATNQISDCVDLRSAQEPKLKTWLAERAPAN